MSNVVKDFLAADEHFQAEVLKQIPTPVMVVTTDMKVQYLNDSAQEMVGRSMDDSLGLDCKLCFNSDHCGTDNCCMVKAMKTKKTQSARNWVTSNGERIPIEYYAVPFFDEDGNVKGGLEFVVDITEQDAFEKKLIEQSKTIQQLSTPTLKLWDGVLMLPIVGVMDSFRAQSMMETMLKCIAESSSQVIILDIQGVAAVDTAVANHLIKITKATKLMGCECILSGISPAVAQTIVHLGIDMNSIVTKSTLSDAVEEAFEILGVNVGV